MYQPSDTGRAVSARCVVIMGVCGAGKSRLAGALARRLDGACVEGDDFHSAGARSRMAAGLALSDAEREPWLDAIAAAACAAVRPARDVVIACSALRRSYRDRLRSRLGPPIFAGLAFVHLTGPRALIAARLAARDDHFVGESLLNSQLAILEPLLPDEAGFTLEISPPVDAVVDRAMEMLAELDPQRTGAAEAEGAPDRHHGSS